MSSPQAANVQHADHSRSSLQVPLKQKKIPNACDCRQEEEMFDTVSIEQVNAVCIVQCRPSAQDHPVYCDTHRGTHPSYNSPALVLCNLDLGMMGRVNSDDGQGELG